jgi:hypothetical protein
LYPEREDPGKGETADGRIVQNLHNLEKGRIVLFIIISICVGKTIMMLKVSQAFVTIVLIMSRVMFLLLETLFVIMPSIILTVMWLL